MSQEATATQQAQTLYERLGGEGAILATVDAFYVSVLQDQELQPFFAETNMEWLKKSQLQFFTQALGGPPVYQGRGMQPAHDRIAITQHHFDLVAGHLVTTLSSLGIQEELIADVISAVAPLAEEIVNTQNSPEENSMSPDASTQTRFNERTAELYSMLENAPVNIMCADKQGMVQYLNPKSVKTLKGIENILPVKVNEIVGHSFDVFHKNPSYQQGLVSDDSRLPLTAIIEVGDEKLDLLLTAMYDSNGDYVGPMVSWEVVTEKLKREADVARMSSMMENAPINIMCSDTNGIIQYLNPKSIATLKTLESILPVKVKDIVGNSFDVFHKNPAYQQGLVKDDSQLPFQAIIEVGADKLDLLLSGMYDAEGDYVGPMVTWEVITQKLQQEADLKDAQERERAAATELSAKVDEMLTVVRAAADGDLTQEVSVNGEDAIGQMGEGLGRLISSLRTSIQAIADNATTLASASEELTATSQQMSASSAETSSQAEVVSGNSRQVSENVQTVAAGTEELSASIKEIARNASSAAEVASEAVRVTAETNTTISRLGDSSQEIGQVIKVITSIAQQTNLLALNATIEAARAGDAGKGFAVVANEVKELAKETAKATEDIGRKIDAIQGDTSESVAAIEMISTIIGQINEAQGTIASAVEEQAATTNEMSRSVSDANNGTTEITRNIDGVAQAAEDSSRGASGVETAASELSKMAAELQSLVGTFKF